MRAMATFIKLFFVFSVLYWASLFAVQPDKTWMFDLFGVLLTVLPLLGFVSGMIIQREWDGYRSYVGKSVIFLSLSLLMWFLGQAIYLIYSFTVVEIPYPGIPDYFWILIDPFYALALVSVMRYTGAVASLRKSLGYLVMLIVPIVSLYINYVIFFGDTSYFEVIDLPVVFDLIYTFGSIAIMSMIAITFLLSVAKLGGKMKLSIYLLYIGIVTQYIGDVAYTILTAQDQVYNGNLSDFIYFISIAFTTLGILKLNTKILTNEQNGTK